MIVVHNSDTLLDAADPTLEVSGGVVRLSGFGSTVIVTLTETDLKLITTAIWQKSGDTNLRGALKPPPPPPPKPEPLTLEAFTARAFRALQYKRVVEPNEISTLYSGRGSRNLGIHVIGKLVGQTGYGADIGFWFDTCTPGQKRAMGHTLHTLMNNEHGLSPTTPYAETYDKALKWIESNGGVMAISRRYVEKQQAEKDAEEKRDRELRRLGEQERVELARMRGEEARRTAAKPTLVPDPPKDPITYVPRKG